MRKRERENPCGVCSHYHKFEEGEVCEICGHRVVASSEKTPLQVTMFPSEILPEFLYLGTYDNASLVELLKAQGISHVLNTVAACQNLYKNRNITYHCLQFDETFPFDAAAEYLEQCERDKARVLVHCMTGKSRSPAFVIAFLMKCKGWRLDQSYQLVKERRPSVNLTESVYQQLQEYEQKVFGMDLVPITPLDTIGATSIVSSPTVDVPSQETAFGTSQTQTSSSASPFGASPRK